MTLKLGLIATVDNTSCSVNTGIDRLELKAYNFSQQAAHSYITNDAECQRSYIAVVIPIPMIHVVQAAGGLRLTWFSGMRIHGGLTESTATYDSLTPWDTETAGTVKPRRLFRSSFLEPFSGAPWKQSETTMASWISTEDNLFAHELIADWCVRLTWTNGVRVTP